MAIKLKWETLSNVRTELESAWKLNPSSKVIFVLLLKDGSHHKKTVRFSEFLKFFWFIYDSTNFHVKGLIVQDTKGKVLYRHRQATGEHEEIPSGGNVYIFDRWTHLTENQKDVHLNILLSQIHDHSESSNKSNG